MNTTSNFVENFLKMYYFFSNVGTFFKLLEHYLKLHEDFLHMWWTFIKICAKTCLNVVNIFLIVMSASICHEFLKNYANKLFYISSTFFKACEIFVEWYHFFLVSRTFLQMSKKCWIVMNTLLSMWQHFVSLYVFACYSTCYILIFSKVHCALKLFTRLNLSLCYCKKNVHVSIFMKF